MSESPTPDNIHPLVRRKRVVAREVESSNIDSASLTPAQLEPLDALPPAPLPGQDTVPATAASVPVVDPTTLGRRNRRSGHQAVYRWTQALTLLGAALGCVSLICTMADEPTIGRLFAAAGAVVGVVALALSGRTSLSQRWRGWAIATIVFAVAALAMTWVHATLVENESSTPRIRSVK